MKNGDVVAKYLDLVETKVARQDLHHTSVRVFGHDHPSTKSLLKGLEEQNSIITAFLEETIHDPDNIS